MRQYLNNKKLEVSRSIPDSWGYAKFKSNKPCSSGALLKYKKCNSGSYALVIDACSKELLWRYRSMDYLNIEVVGKCYKHMEEFIQFVKQTRIGIYY